MTARVKVLPSGHEFLVEGAESILDASVRAGLNLAYGCSSGNCGLCKARVVSGEVRPTRSHDYVLSELERRGGIILICCNTPQSDLTLEAPEAKTVGDLPEQEIRASVRKLEPLGENLSLVHVQTPRTQSLRFMAGQRAELVLESGRVIQPPIASCPCNGRIVQFLLRTDTGIPFSEVSRRELRPGKPVTIKGPRGAFVLQEEVPIPTAFVAVDDGFAPIKSLIEHAIAIDRIPAFYLYWLSSSPGGHYLDRLCRSWRDSLDNFAYTPLVDTDPRRLIERMAEDHRAPELLEYYVAGPGTTAECIGSLLHAVGARPERIHPDAPLPD